VGFEEQHRRPVFEAFHHEFVVGHRKPRKRVADVLIAGARWGYGRLFAAFRSLAECLLSRR
jgi:hypothetical protein